MQFATPLFPATLVRRYKRFLADVVLPDGTEVTATCPNTGAMLGLCEPGAAIYLSRSENPKRKYAWTWHITNVPGIGQVGIDTSLPNRIVEEAINQNQIGELSGYNSLRREVRYGENSRIDLLLEHPARPACYVEVKNVTLIRQPGLAEFPDCRTERGAKHLRELAAMVRDGHRAVMVYLIQCASPTRFTFTPDLDATYVAEWTRAKASGVEALALTCHVSPDSITLNTSVPVIDPL